MFRTLCPYCDQEWHLEDDRENHNIRCSECGRIFAACRIPGDAWPPPLPPAPAADTAARPAPPDPVPPLLTNPFTCQQCRKSIQSPTAKRKTLLLCPLCNLPASLYSVIYHCPVCQALLESPQAQRGNTSCCPHCFQDFQVPWDVVQQSGEGRTEPGSFFFPCPNCQCRLKATRELAARLAICPQCLFPFTVPAGGESQADLLPSFPDAIDSIHGSTTRHCPHCGTLMPAQAHVCRACGRPSE